jgi:Flp pilus assembly protein TadB
VQPVPVYRGWGQAGACRQTAGQASQEAGEEEPLNIFQLLFSLFFVLLFVFLLLVLVFLVLVLLVIIFLVL